MKTATCRLVQKELSAARMAEFDDVGRLLVESHIEVCHACRDFAQVSESLNRVSTALAPQPIPPLLERRTVLAALDGRMPVCPNRRPLAPRFALVGMTAAAVFTIPIRFTSMTSASRAMSEGSKSSPIPAQ